jgi:hypothetical protein
MGILLFIMCAALAIAALAGWVMNIAALLTGIMGGLSDAGPDLVLRSFGVPFAPLGAVLGWF